MLPKPRQLLCQNSSLPSLATMGLYAKSTSFTRERIHSVRCGPEPWSCVAINHVHPDKLLKTTLTSSWVKTTGHFFGSFTRTTSFIDSISWMSIYRHRNKMALKARFWVEAATWWSTGGSERTATSAAGPSRALSPTTQRCPCPSRGNGALAP
jgi:hypothetical protein